MMQRRLKWQVCLCPKGSCAFVTLYRRLNQFPAFVLISCLRTLDKLDEDCARATKLLDLNIHAVLIQVKIDLQQSTP